MSEAETSLLSILGTETQKLYHRIVKINQNRMVTVDDLLEPLDSMERQDTLIDAIQELIGAGFLQQSTSINRGRFETQLIPIGGHCWEKGKPPELPAKVLARRK